MIDSTDEALDVLRNTRLAEQEREAGIHYLRDNPTPAGTEALVAALKDNDAGVRWSAGAALAELGEDALLPLLEALSSSANDTWMREGARHVLHYSSSSEVRAQTQELMEALRGPSADIASMEAAYELLSQFRAA
jgi:HEAT repeat protein